MPSIRDLYPDTYLKPAHLRGRTVTVKIQTVYIDNFWNPRENEKQPALVVRMVGKQLPLILNKTQTFAISAILGDEDYTNWAGGSICLQPGKSRDKDTILVTAPDGRQLPPASAVAIHPDTELGEDHPDGENGDESARENGDDPQ